MINLRHNIVSLGNVLDLPQLKPFSEHKLYVDQMIEFDSERLENNVGKGENAGYQHFLLFPQCFQMSSLPASLKVCDVWQRFKSLVGIFLPVIYDNHEITHCEEIELKRPLCVERRQFELKLKAVGTR